MDKDYKLIEIKSGKKDGPPGEAVIEVPGGEKKSFKETK